MANITLPFGASATRRPPVAELASGYPCGPLDRDLDNWLEWWTTGQIAGLISKSGLSVDDTDLNRAAKAVRSFGLNFRTAGGTANALTLDLDPDVTSMAELLNVPLLVKAASANTATTVTVAVDALTAVPLKRLGGGALNIGDVQPSFYYLIVWDGTQFQIVSTIAPAAGASTTAAPLLKSIDAAISVNNSIPTSAGTILNFQTTNRNRLGTSTWNGTRLTVGSGEGGLWYIQAAWAFFSPADGVYAATQLRVNGTTLVGEGCYPYNASGGGTIVQAQSVVPLAAGDYIEALAYQQSGSTQPAYASPRARFVAALISAY